MVTALGVTDIRFSPDGFEYDYLNYKKVQETVKIDLVTAPAVEASRRFVGSWSLKLTYDAGSLPKNKVTGNFLYRNWADPPPLGLFIMRYTSTDLLRRVRSEGTDLCRSLQHLAGICQGCQCAPAHLHPAGRSLAGDGDQAPHP
jgi:hypothetical protein